MRNRAFSLIKISGLRPTGYYSVKKWLEYFAYRIDVSWWKFGSVALIKGIWIGSLPAYFR